MGNNQGTSFDDDAAIRFMQNSGELIAMVPQILGKEIDASIQPTEEQILEDNLHIPNQDEIQIQKEELRTEEEQIINRLKELYPILPQGKRDVIAETKMLLIKHKKVQNRLDIISLSLSSLEKRMQEGIRLQATLKLSIAKDIAEINQAAINSINTNVGPILSQLPSNMIPISVPEIAQHTPDMPQGKTDR